MARDRDHASVAARAALDAQRLRDAWEDYVDKGKALEAIRACGATCPDFAGDVVPTTCQILHGHDGSHRHRVLGSQVVMTW